MRLPKISHSVLGLLLMITVVTGFACSPMQAADDSNAAEFSSTSFALSGASSTLTTNESEQLVTTGGSAPFTYSVLGLGTVTSAGLYTAPSAISTSNDVATVSVVDSTGESRTFEITILQSSNLSYTISPTNPGTTTQVTITPTSGLAPYTYVITAGSGSLNSNIYTTASFSETALVTFTDSSGQTGIATISTGTGAGTTPLASVSMTPEGTHTPGGGGCPSNAFPIGTVADAGPNGNVGIYGDQVFCGINGTASAGSQIVSNFYVTAGGAHVANGYSCPGGYTQLGQVADCQGGYCSGNQNICVASSSYSSAPQIVYDIYITAENVHSVTAPTCNGGYTSVGQIADCGNGNCYGLQSVCVQY